MKKIISLILCVLLAVGAVAVLPVGAASSQGDEADPAETGAQADLAETGKLLYIQLLKNGYGYPSTGNWDDVNKRHSVKFGEYFTFPTDMIEPDLTFKGWYYGGRYFHKGDKVLINDPIYQQPNVSDYIQIYAIWDGIYYIHHHYNCTIRDFTHTVKKVNPEFTTSEPWDEGYKFVGWYYDKEFTRPFPTGTVTLTSDVDIYAKWEKMDDITVTYVMNGHGTQLEPEKVTYNSVFYATRPTDDEYTLEGWYRDPGLTENFAMGSPRLTEDITLYAKWTKNPDYVNITYVNNGYDENTTGKVVLGQSISNRPGRKMTENKKWFRTGWYTDSALQHEYDGEPVYTDTTLYAKWVPLYATESFRYWEPEEGCCEIVGYIAPDVKPSVLVIPAELDGKKVLGVGTYFLPTALHSSLKTVTFEYGIEYIGAGTFQSMEKLEFVNIPETVKEIGDKAFYRTTINRVYVPAQTIVGRSAFYNDNYGESAHVVCEKDSPAWNSAKWCVRDPMFEYTILEDGTARIDKMNVVSANTALVIDTLWDGTQISEIGPNALLALDKSSNSGKIGTYYTIIVSDRVRRIGSYAFSPATSSSTFDYRKRVYLNLRGDTQLDRYAISSLGSESNLYITVVGDEDIPDGFMDEQGGAIKLLTIEGSVKNIGKYAFSYMDIANLKLKNGIRSIGEYAFYNEKLTEVEVPASVREIGDYAIGFEKDSVNETPSRVSGFKLTGVGSGVEAYAKKAGFKLFTPAEEKYDLWLGDKQVSNLNYFDILGNGKASFDPAMNVLSLNGATVTGSHTGALDISGSIYYEGFDLTVEGSGTIGDGSADTGIYSYDGGLSLSGDFTFKGDTAVTISGDVSFDSGSFSMDCAVMATGTIVIRPNVTRLEIDAEGYSMFSWSDIILGKGIRITEPKNAVLEYGGISDGYGNNVTHVIFEGVPQTEKVDKPTGVKVTSAQDTTLSVRKLTPGSIVTEVNGHISAVYDISLQRNGETVQPDGTVTVRIPCSDPDAKVYRVESDDRMTNMKAEYIDGYLVFKTDHFSLYVVATSAAGVSYIRGDVDKSGKVNVFDASYILKGTTGTKDYPDYKTMDKDSVEFKRADVDASGTVNIFDAAIVLKHATGDKSVEKYGVGREVSE